MNKKNYLRWALAALLIPAAAFAATTTFQTDSAKLGRPNSNNKDFIFDLNAGSANPRIRANGTTSKLQFTNDGTIYSDIGSGTGGGGVGTNFLSDPNGQSFPSGSAWTVTSGTGSADTSVYTDGLQSMKVTASSQQSTLSQDVTPTAQMTGQNWQATMWVKTSMTNVHVCARVATIQTNCQAVASNNTWAPYTATFVGPSSGSVGVEVSMTSSASGSFNAQLGYLGKATSVAMVAPDHTDWSSLSGLTYLGMGTVGTNAAFARREGDSIHIKGNVTWGSGGAVNVGIQLPGTLVIDSSKLSSATNATYLGKAHLGDGTQIESSGVGLVVFYDGSTTNEVFITRVAASSGASTYAKALGNTFASSDTMAYDFTVPIVAYSGSSQQQGYRVDATPASWSGYQDATSGWSTSSGSQADLSAGSGITTTEVANRNFGTVSAAGSSLPGITFTAPRAGRYYVCAHLVINNSTAANTTMYLVDGSGTFIANAYYAMPSTVPGQVPACGVYNVASVGSVTFKIQGKVASGTGSLLTNNSSIAHPIQWSIVEMDAPMPTPFLTGSVTTTATSQEHIERAILSDNGSVDAIVSQSGTWISSVNRAGQGQFVLTIAAGEFSSEPACNCSARNSAAAICRVNTGGTNNSTTKSFIVTDVSGIALDPSGVDVMCMGPR